MRTLDLAMLDSVNPESMFERIISAFSDMGLPLNLIGCWVANCRSGNGIEDVQAHMSNKFWALLKTKVTPLCGRFWNTDDVFNLCLRDQWHKKESSDFLEKLSELFLISCYRTQPTKWKGPNYASVFLNYYAHSRKHETEYDRKKPPVCNLAENYKAWIQLCERRSSNSSSSAGHNWKSQLEFLMQPLTYLKVHMLVDICRIIIVHSKIVEQTEYVDFYQKAEIVIALITRYCDDSPSCQDSIVYRALVEYQTWSKHWYIQKCLIDIGYSKAMTIKCLKFSIGTTELDMKFDRESFRWAYLWARKFCSCVCSARD